MECSLPGSSVHGTLQARILEWVAISFSTPLYSPCMEQGIENPLLSAPLSSYFEFHIPANLNFFCFPRHTAFVLSLCVFLLAVTSPLLCFHCLFQFSSVQFSRSVMPDSLRPHELQHARPPCPSPTPRVHSNSTSIKSVMPSSHLILYRPLFLLPPIPPNIRVFSNESTLRMRYPKYWSFSFSIIPSKEHPGLISFRMDWLDLLAVRC